MGRVFTKYNENHKGMIEMTVSQLCGRPLRRSLASSNIVHLASLRSAQITPSEIFIYPQNVIGNCVYQKGVIKMNHQLNKKIGF